ncbi:hypothetical protein ACFW04_013662 [Cataglyphis niger]
MAKVGFTQIDLHHSKGVSAVFARRMTVVHTCITLMQKPCLCVKLFKSPTEPNPKAVIAVKELKAQLMPEFCSRNVAAIMADLRKSNMVNSAYFPHEEKGSLPPGPVVNLHQYQRGRLFLEYLVATDLEILNRGNESTFQNVLKREVFDLTLCSRNLVTEIVEWQVSYEPSLSDHRLSSCLPM